MWLFCTLVSTTFVSLDKQIEEAINLSSMEYREKEIKNEKFSFVHIDVDLYEPTMKSLEFFFPRLVKGGIIVCDDYNSNIFNGAKKAWDKYFKNIKFDYFFHNPLGGCFLIK